jgi:hypothetical protein
LASKPPSDGDSRKDGPGAKLGDRLWEAALTRSPVRDGRGTHAGHLGDLGDADEIVFWNLLVNLAHSVSIIHTQPVLWSATIGYAKGARMHVTVEDVPQVRVRNKGILIRIREEGGEQGGRNVGKLWIGQANIRWAAGSIPKQNAKTLSMTRFVEFLNSL